jgi:hypothetical protein
VVNLPLDLSLRRTVASAWLVPGPLFVPGSRKWIEE